MGDSIASASHQTNRELRALYDGSAEGILIAEIRSKAIGSRESRRSAGCSATAKQELLSLSVGDMHPADRLPHVSSSSRR